MKKALAATLLAVALALPVLATSASAADDVLPGRTIEAFTGTNLVDIQGYPANQQVTVEVLRKGVLVGTVTGETDADGFAEFNHGGGGQFPEGDCFAGNATPDIVAGDVIRARAASDPAGRFDSAVVRDLGVNFDTITTDTRTNTITVSGHVRSRPNAQVVPRSDVLELRLNKGNVDNRWEAGPGLDQDRPNRRDLRVDIGNRVQQNGSWTRVLRVSHDDALDWKRNPGEVGLEWSAGGGEELTPPAIFVADEAGGEAIVGCPPLAEYGIQKSNVKAINAAFVKGNANLVLSGVSFNASAVNVTLGGVAADTVTLSSPDGVQTWRATFSNAKVGALRDGMLAARATYTVSTDVLGNEAGPATFNGANLRILKDTVAPTRAPVASPRSGVYNRAISVSLSSQAGMEIHYQFDRSRLTVADREFVKSIRVTGTQTIRAAAFDRAGNRGPIGSYRYVIR